jgi:hypothetical protein
MHADHETKTALANRRDNVVPQPEARKPLLIAYD